MVPEITRHTVVNQHKTPQSLLWGVFSVNLTTLSMTILGVGSEPTPGRMLLNQQ
jgi:hypothetical protein